MTEESVMVVFVDEKTKKEIGRSQTPISQLPESFLIATRLHIRDEEWSVVRAEPSTSAEFRVTGKLVLHLARIERLSPKDILFTLPSISNESPAIAPGAIENRPGTLDLHEDDWRQAELVSVQFEQAVSEELDLIRRVCDEESVPVGQGRAFRSCHVRRGVPRPIAAGVRFADIASLATIASCERSQLQMSRAGGRVADGFAFRLPRLWLYGQSHKGEIGVLAIHATQGSGVDTGDTEARTLVDLMQRHDLLLVDWCRCFVTSGDAAAVAGYLAD